MGAELDINKELGKRIRKGDVKAFDEVYRRFSQRLYGFAFSMLKNKEDAKEVVQETFLKLWNNRKQIDTDYSMKSFLFSISYNIIVDIIRAKSKDIDFQNSIKTYLKSNVEAADEKVQFKELNEKVKALVEELPNKRREIYILSREDGLSHKEIAEKLGITVKTVENQIGLSLKYMRSKLDSDSLLVLLFLFLFV